MVLGLWVENSQLLAVRHFNRVDHLQLVLHSLEVNVLISEQHKDYSFTGRILSSVYKVEQGSFAELLAVELVDESKESGFLVGDKARNLEQSFLTTLKA